VIELVERGRDRRDAVRSCTCGHWPYRPIRSWEDELVEKEIVEATQWAGWVDTDAARAYVMGVRIAAIELGHTPPVCSRARNCGG
jgi:hypothetical protein